MPPFNNEQCVFTSQYHGGNSTHRGVIGGAGSLGNAIGTAIAKNSKGVTAPINMFGDPAAVYDQVRAPILGIDTKNRGVGPIVGLRASF